MSTPVSPLQCVDLPEDWPRAQLWVKRDDLLGEGGSKVRKLRVEIARALAADARWLVTFGHLDSNHLLATARAARAVGLRCELCVLMPGKRVRSLGFARDDKIIAGDDTAQERLELLRAEADVVTVATNIPALLRAGLAGMTHRERRWVLPPGGTTRHSTAEIALAVCEIADQFSLASTSLPTRWAVAVGSGGTLAGLWAGIKLGGLGVVPVGFACSSRWIGAPAISALANGALALMGSDERVEPAEVEVSFSQWGGGHGLATPQSEEVRSALASRLELDPVFTAKAMAGLRDRLSGSADEWLFVHTGTTVR